MSCYVGSNREMFMYTSMWWLRQDKQTCLRPFTHRHSVSRVEETHRLCTLVTLKADCNPDDSIPLRSWAVGFFFPALKQQTKSAWNATWVPESNEPWHSSQKHLLFTTSKSLACALQTNFNWSPSVQLNNEPEERNSKLRNKGRSIPLGSCPPQVITAAGQGQKKEEEETPSIPCKTRWWNRDKSSHSLTPESASLHATGFGLLFELGEPVNLLTQWCSFL